MFKVNNKDRKNMLKIKSKDRTTFSGVFIVNVEHISHLFLVFLLLTFNT